MKRNGRRPIVYRTASNSCPAMTKTHSRHVHVEHTANEKARPIFGRVHIRGMFCCCFAGHACPMTRPYAHLASPGVCYSDEPGPFPRPPALAGTSHWTLAAFRNEQKLAADRDCSPQKWQQNWLRSATVVLKIGLQQPLTPDRDCSFNKQQWLRIAI
nr:hypothetical protein CFP56_73182 [Quercus suber]